MFNTLLQRQIQNYLGDEKKISPELLALLNAVSNSYDHYEKDMNILKRVMELNAAELLEIHKKLHESLMVLREEETATNEICDQNNLALPAIADLLKKESKKRKESELKLRENLVGLEKINKELDQFTYVVSHDLKAPLRAISSLTAYLEEDLAHTIDGETKKHFTILKSRVTRMENFITGLLEYSKSGKSDKSEMVDTGILIKEIIDWLHCPAHISINVTQNFPILHTDKIKIDQVLSNLIGNAIKYNDKEEGLIEVGCTDFEDWTQFYVKDNGPGIEQQFHNKIFELFHTLENRDKIESTGIGLAIVKKIIEEQGGKIWVESERGKGAKFIFTYPKIKSN